MFDAVILLIIGIIIGKILTPTFDEFGVRIKILIFTLLNKDKKVTYTTYLRLHKTITEIHTKHGHNFFRERKPFLTDHSVNLEKNDNTDAQLRNVITVWIKQTPINSYNESDIFFAGLELLSQYLTKEHIREVYKVHCENDQANLWAFLGDIEKQTKGLLTTDILDYVHTKQKEYEELYTKDK